MPIYQGNYVAPVWINNVPPAINDTELLAISGKLADSQILTGTGAPTQYTSGVEGQRYADTSTTPPTIYKLVMAETDANVWVPDDANGNLASEYDPTSTYAEADYCIHDGMLYRANTDIDPAESWNSAHWERSWLGDDLSAHVEDTNNPHGVTAAQAAYDNTDSGLTADDAQEAIDELASGKQPSITAGSVTLSLSWSGSGPYTQTVTVTGVTITANSRVSFEPTAAQLASLIADGVTALTIENNNGTLTVYALGAAPSAAMTLACTVTEVGA